MPSAATFRASNNSGQFPSYRGPESDRTQSPIGDYLLSSGTGTKDMGVNKTDMVPKIKKYPGWRSKIYLAYNIPYGALIRSFSFSMVVL